MNPSDTHRKSYQVTRGGGLVTTYTSRHILSPSTLAAPAFVHHDQEGRAAQGVQRHAQSVGTDVGQLVPVREERLTRAQLFPNFPPPQTFFPHGPLQSSAPEQYHVRLDPNSPYTVGVHRPRTLASSRSTFDQRAYLPQDSLRTICDANDVFWMDLHSNTSAPEFADQPHAHLTTHDTQRPIQSGWPTNTRVGLAQLERSSTAFNDQEDVPSHSGYAGASTVYTRLESAVSASPPNDHYPAQSPPPTLGSYLPFTPSTSAPIQRPPPYQALDHESASAFASSWPSVLGSAASPANSPVRSNEHDEQAGTDRTMRSIRTKSGDVYAEYELSTDRAGGRWVCQCGSTFVRDSDWERHAVHSLSHGVGGGFDCSICDISFTRSDAMSRHLRKKHGGLKAQVQGTEGADE
ncbi:hypothetical protein EDB92DRAFT_1951266 [Lactarius akahatsu]|uniref:C2H2-type domain-containing protein n=1 Tax=Lactarius akahatsu TaxID=416441 RepID=A0AAD4L7W0_9AGAM|nr:hypothetical protein EDB92DRAFT_1951266 [Lactarius akahatsu]